MKKKTYLNEEQIAHVQELRAQGVDCQTIANIFDIAQSTVSRYAGQARRPAVVPDVETPETPITGQVSITEAINDANLASLVVQSEAIIERLDTIIELLSGGADDGNRT